ncbi:hypothetical protein [Flavobacterium sp.]|uniref:hypothetical protein n=1 Tax=Flavobacterium sp. TaxID=239 RepID=UPI000AD8EEDE|nr:hypothetical protein [Flavobacterium sp.]HBD26509.1 hypothetical protein [Flavobacterium sp.]
MIEDFVDSVLIIDDKENDISKLKSLLDEKQIWSMHLLPEDLLQNKLKIKNRKLIFLDLFVDESKAEVKDQVSIIRRIFSDSIGTDFGSYGLILWTKHYDQFDDFKMRFYKSYEKYQLPMFIVALDKSKYLRDGFENIFVDLQKQLYENPSASFFINWEVIVKKSKDLSIGSVYNLVNKNSESLNDNLKYIMFQLARNFTGIPYDKLNDYDLEHDAIKAFSDLLAYNISNANSSRKNLFVDWENISYNGVADNITEYKYSVKNYLPDSSDKKEIYKNGTLLTKSDKKTLHSGQVNDLEEEIRKIQSQINSILLIDHTNTNTNKILPGNVYQVLKNNDFFLIKELPENSIPLVIEITPPCDFSQNKLKKRRIISGFMTDYSKELKEKFNGDNYYKEIWPISLEGKTQMIIFDFRYFGSMDEKKLLDKRNYKILFRTKDKLFADILQKLSSHTARLGLSIIH